MTTLNIETRIQIFCAALQTLGPSAVFGGMTFLLTNLNGTAPLTGVSFSDTLPGLVIATPNGLSATTCVPPGTLTATAAANTISLTDATLPAGGSCSFSLNVVGLTPGAQVNTTTVVTSTNGGNGSAATALSTVIAVNPPVLTKSFGTANVLLNGTTTLTFTVSNPNTTVPLTSVGFTHTLPSGLIISTPTGLTGTCAGGTITAAAGSNSISLAGATLAASGACSFSVTVNGTTPGVQNNTTSPVTSANGGNGLPASASLTVGPATPPTEITDAYQLHYVANLNIGVT